MEQIWSLQEVFEDSCWLTPDKQRHFSEDCLLISDKIIGVFDGATPLAKKRYTDGSIYPTDASWASQVAADSIKNYNFLTSDPIQFLFNGLIKRFREETDIQPEEIPVEELPSTTASFAIYNDFIIHFYQIGDSPILIRKKDGFIHTMPGDTKLAKLDAITIDTITKLATENSECSRSELFYKAGVVERRKQFTNRKNGFGVLVPQEPELLHYQSISFNSSDIESFIIMSDGMYVHKEVFNPALTDDEFYNQAVQPSGLACIGLAINDSEKADADCQLYPRMKMSDDKTALTVKIN